MHQQRTIRRSCFHLLRPRNTSLHSCQILRGICFSHALLLGERPSCRSSLNSTCSWVHIFQFTSKNWCCRTYPGTVVTTRFRFHITQDRRVVSDLLSLTRALSWGDAAVQRVQRTRKTAVQGLVGAVQRVLKKIQLHGTTKLDALRQAQRIRKIYVGMVQRSARTRQTLARLN